MAGQLSPDNRLSRLRRRGMITLAGLALLLALMALGLGQASLSPRTRFVVRPEQPVFGVSVGSPVRLRGVVAGEVAAVRLWQRDAGSPLRPELVLSLDTRRCPGSAELASQVRQGLRVELVPVNPASGFLEVDLVWRPGAAAALASDDPFELPTSPATPSPVSRAAGFLRAIAGGDPAGKAGALAASIDAAQVALADPPRLAADAAAAARDLRDLAAGLERDIGGGAVPSLARLAEARERLRSLALALDAASLSLRDAAQAAPEALSRLGAALRGGTGPASGSPPEPPAR